MILLNKQVYLTYNGLLFFLEVNREFIEKDNVKLIVKTIKDQYKHRWFNVWIYQYKSR